MAEVQQNICQNADMTENLEKMLNNPTYADTVFFVNDTKFFASSHLVSISSSELESTLRIHYENCGDREINIGKVTFEDSFLVVLRFLYGLGTDLSHLEKPVICEVVCLAERFKLDKFLVQLKYYLSTLDDFQVDFIVLLLNTAKKFGIDNLYRKLTVWAFENTDQLVNHASLVNLQYNVLLDLVKADYFCTPEINILKAILDWHENNLNEEIEIKNITCNDKTENNDSNEVDNESAYDACKDIVRNQDLKIDSKESEDTVNNTKTESNNSNDVNETKVSYETSDNNAFDQTIDLKKTQILMKEFSVNVLKSLLFQVRASCINIIDMYKLLEKESYTKYKEFLSERKYFSDNSLSRIKYSTENTNQIQESNFLRETFTIGGLVLYDTMYESKEVVSFCGMDWKLSVKDTSAGIVEVYLNCISPGSNEWECSAEFQVKLLPLEGSEVFYIPGENEFTTVQLSSKNLCIKLGTILLGKARYKYKFEVQIKLDMVGEKHSACLCGRRC